MLADNSDRYCPERDLVDNLTGQVVPDPSNNQTASDPYVDVGPRGLGFAASGRHKESTVHLNSVDRNTSMLFGTVGSSDLTVDRAGSTVVGGRV
jgi:hypothetical protein